MSRFTSNNDSQKVAFQGVELERVKRELEALDASLKARFVQGRLRTDRAAPSSASNVVATDKEGDVVRTATYEYTVVNNGSALKWARSAIDTGW